MPEDYGPFDRHDLPDGSAVFFKEKIHRYYREAVEKKGEWAGKGTLTGISTVSKPFDWEPDALMRWAAKSNGTGIALLAADALSLDDPDQMRDALSFLSSQESIWQALEDAKLTYEDLRAERADQGTNVHKYALHALATGKPVPQFDRMTDEERGFARGVVAFWHECDPEPTGAEQVVADLDEDGTGTAGTLDLRAQVMYQGERVSAIVDAKTGFVGKTAHVQVEGYEYDSVMCGHDPTDVRLILRVDAAGGYQLIESTATGEDFVAAVDVYRRAARVAREAAQAYRARQAELELAA